MRLHSFSVLPVDLTHSAYLGSVRISSCGIFDVLLFGSPQPDLATLQQEDLLKFGRLIFALCSGNLAAATPANLQKSVEAMKKVYGVEVQALALFLCSSKIKKVCMPSALIVFLGSVMGLMLVFHSVQSIDEVLDMIRPKVLQEQDEALMWVSTSRVICPSLIKNYLSASFRGTDRLENELMGELENARLFRLMCKFGFINERPECVASFFIREQCSRPTVKDLPAMHAGQKRAIGTLSSSSAIMCFIRSTSTAILFWICRMCLPV